MHQLGAISGQRFLLLDSPILSKVNGSLRGDDTPKEICQCLDVEENSVYQAFCVRFNWLGLGAVVPLAPISIPVLDKLGLPPSHLLADLETHQTELALVVHRVEHAPKYGRQDKGRDGGAHPRPVRVSVVRPLVDDVSALGQVREGVDQQHLEVLLPLEDLLDEEADEVRDPALVGVPVLLPLLVLPLLPDAELLEEPQLRGKVLAAPPALLRPNLLPAARGPVLEEQLLVLPPLGHEDAAEVGGGAPAGPVVAGRDVVRGDRVPDDDGDEGGVPLRVDDRHGYAIDHVDVRAQLGEERHDPRLRGVEDLLQDHGPCRVVLDHHPQQSLEEVQGALVLQVRVQLLGNAVEERRLWIVPFPSPQARRQVRHVQGLLLQHPHQLLEAGDPPQHVRVGLHPSLELRGAHRHSQVQNLERPYVLGLDLALPLAQVVLADVGARHGLVPEPRDLLHEAIVEVRDLLGRHLEAARLLVLRLAVELQLHVVPRLARLRQVRRALAVGVARPGVPPEHLLRLPPRLHAHGRVHRRVRRARGHRVLHEVVVLPLEPLLRVPDQAQAAVAAVAPGVDAGLLHVGLQPRAVPRQDHQEERVPGRRRDHPEVAAAALLAALQLRDAELPWHVYARRRRRGQPQLAPVVLPPHPKLRGPLAALLEGDRQGVLIARRDRVDVPPGLLQERLKLHGLALMSLAIAADAAVSPADPEHATLVNNARVEQGAMDALDLEVHGADEAWAVLVLQIPMAQPAKPTHAKRQESVIFADERRVLRAACDAS
mmetsp:Transcript_366/g.996  ORF Transcript_366/g.996 Transcript_366/m.996 type:complete len:770 (-) Transcript_366:188-2497(-)